MELDSFSRRMAHERTPASDGSPLHVDGTVPPRM